MQYSAVREGVVAGAVTVQVIGLSVLIGVAVGIVTATYALPKVRGVLAGLRSRPS